MPTLHHLLSRSLVALLLSPIAFAAPPTPSAGIQSFVTPAPKYPAARRSDHIDTYFGTAVPDPYRWMEDVDSPEVKTWVDAENTLTRATLDGVPGRSAMHARLTALNNFERFSPPIVRNNRFFYTHNTGLQNQSVLLWQEGIDDQPHTLLDPNTLSADGTVALQSYNFTDDGKLMAYALAEAGSDWIKWHVREVSSGHDLPDVVAWSKFSGAAWLHDGSGFFYSGYGIPPAVAAQPAEAAPSHQPGNDAASLKQAQFFHKVFFHRLGTPQTADTVIYERADDKELLLGADTTDDGRYLLLSAGKGHTNSLAAVDLSRFDLRRPSPTAILQIAPVADARYEPIATDGDTLWLHTNAEAPNGRVVAVNLRHPERTAWEVVLPETRHNLEEITMVDDTFVAGYLADAQSLVELHDRSGRLLSTVTLPGIGNATAFTGRRTDKQSFFAFTNFTTPVTVLRLDLPSHAVTTYRAPKLNFNPADFETHQVFATSKDGTRVPVFITGKRGLPRDGNTPTVLYAYGGFNVSLLPQFSASYLMWMEMGGLFAQASLRGGGEYGEKWHEAGTLTHKQNVFDDFIGAAEYLEREHYTNPKKLAIEGGSNGGLLIGAVEEQRPELFAAALAHVGVMDMLRFDQFTIGYAWRSDYGSPSANETDFRNILKYSPVHNVRTGLKYPPTLVFTADHDDRVFPAHSFKFTAAMQHALTEDATATPPVQGGPVLIRVETRAGHGGGMPLSKRIDMTVDSFSFLSHYLDMPVTLPQTP